MRERIEVVSMAEGWDEQKFELGYYLDELQSLIYTMKKLLNKSPEWPTKVAAIKDYATTLGMVDNYQISVMIAARQTLADEYTAEPEVLPMITVNLT